MRVRSLRWLVCIGLFAVLLAPLAPAEAATVSSASGPYWDRATATVWGRTTGDYAACPGTYQCFNGWVEIWAYRTFRFDRTLIAQNFVNSEVRGPAICNNEYWSYELVFSQWHQAYGPWPPYKSEQVMTSPISFRCNGPQF